MILISFLFISCGKAVQEPEEEKTINQPITTGTAYEETLSLFEAVQKNDLSGVKKALQRGADINHQEGNISPLMTSLQLGFPKLSKELIKLGASIETEDENGLNALEISLKQSFTDLASFLIEKGAKLPRDTSILSDLISEERDQALNLALSQGIDLEYNPDRIDSALNLAIFYQKPQLIPLLIKFGADPNAKGRDNLNPILFASYYSNFESLLELSQYPLDINATDNSGKTALHHAVINKQHEIADILFYDLGANKSLEDKGGNTACKLAKKNKDQRMRKLLKCFPYF